MLPDASARVGTGSFIVSSLATLEHARKKDVVTIIPVRSQKRTRRASEKSVDDDVGIGAGVREGRRLHEEACRRGKISQKNCANSSPLPGVLVKAMTLRSGVAATVCAAEDGVVQPIAIVSDGRGKTK